MNAPQRADKASPAEKPKRRRSTLQPVGQEPPSLLKAADPLLLHRAIANLSMARPDDILTLQRAVGNQAVHSLIQAKLTVGPVGDHYEQEADRVAQQVMSRPTPVGRQRSIRRQEEEEDQLAQMTPLVPTITPVVQRQEMDEEDEDALQMKSLVQRQELEDEELAQMQPAIQRQELEEEELAQMKPAVQRQEMDEDEELQIKSLVQRQELDEEEELQTKPQSPIPNPQFPKIQRQELEEEEELAQMKPGQGEGSFEAGSDVESRLSSRQGSGDALPDGTRADMESRFGTDFSGVRVHADGEAVQLSQELGAKAFTHGRDIYFGSGKYDPGSSSGQRLLAHELTHVVQQTGGQTASRLDRTLADHTRPQVSPGSTGVQRKLEEETKKELDRLFEDALLAKATELAKEGKDEGDEPTEAEINAKVQDAAPQLPIPDQYLGSEAEDYWKAKKKVASGEFGTPKFRIGFGATEKKYRREIVLKEHEKIKRAVELLTEVPDNLDTGDLELSDYLDTGDLKKDYLVELRQRGGGAWEYAKGRMQIRKDLEEKGSKMQHWRVTSEQRYKGRLVKGKHKKWKELIGKIPDELLDKFPGEWSEEDVAEFDKSLIKEIQEVYDNLTAEEVEYWVGRQIERKYVEKEDLKELRPRFGLAKPGKGYYERKYEKAQIKAQIDKIVGAMDAKQLEEAETSLPRIRLGWGVRYQKKRIQERKKELARQTIREAVRDVDIGTPAPEGYSKEAKQMWLEEMKAQTEGKKVKKRKAGARKEKTPYQKWLEQQAEKEKAKSETETETEVESEVEEAGPTGKVEELRLNHKSGTLHYTLGVKIGGEWKEIDVVGDGGCFYHALARAKILHDNPKKYTGMSFQELKTSLESEKTLGEIEGELRKTFSEQLQTRYEQDPMTIKPTVQAAFTEIARRTLDNNIGVGSSFLGLANVNYGGLSESESLKGMIETWLKKFATEGQPVSTNSNERTQLIETNYPPDPYTEDALVKLYIAEIKNNRKFWADVETAILQDRELSKSLGFGYVKIVTSQEQVTQKKK